jgi:ferric-dicitrate binding protein FerR (iron transport regulator)
MTERKRRVEDMLENMGRMVVPVADESEAEREQVVDAVNRKLDMTHALRGGRGRQRWLFAAAAAALCLSAGLAFAHFRRTEPPLQVAVVQAAPADVFKRGDALHTDAQETRTGTLEDGAKVKLSGGTEVTVSALLPGTDELVLDRGRVDLTVPKLRSGHTLSVTTPDSTVTVRGTRFSVEVVIEGSRATTSVDVTQGSVWVRQGDARLVLEAGSHWSSRALAPPALPAEHVAPAASEPAGLVPPASAVHAETNQSKVAAALGPSRGPADAHSPPTVELSTLAQENDLYQAASRAAREGNDSLTIADLNSLLLHYPNSPLAQNARVDRFRALNRSGRVEEAVAQARRYLADYPNGFARDEAKALVLQSLASP